MRTSRCRPAFRLFVTAALLTWVLHGVAFAAEEGEVIFATYFPSFYQTGGDPATNVSGLPLINQTVFDAVVWASPDQQLLPSLAEETKIAPDWSHIDFFLRDDVKFHNGATMTAVDVKYSLETYLRKDLGFLFRPLWSRTIKEMEIVNPYHLRLHMNAPDPGFLGRLWWGAGIFPKEYREQVGDKGFAEKPVGAGPFKWVEYEQDVYWKVAAVADHYRKTPEIKTLKCIYVPDHSTRLAMLQSGEADIVALIPPHVPVVESDPNLRVVYSKYPVLQTLSFADLVDPDTPSPFHDLRVRKAASLAVNRKAICEKVLYGSAEPYGEILAPITLGYDASIEPDPYDVTAAKALLAEAGYAKGFKTTISTTAPSKYWVEAIAASLAEVGIDAEIVIYEGGAWQQAYWAKKLRGLITSACWWHSERNGVADSSDFFLSYMPWAYHVPPEVHKTVSAGMTAISDEDVAAAGRKISQAVRDSRIRIILWAQHNPYGVGPRVEYWEPQTGAMPGNAFEYVRLKQ